MNTLRLSEEQLEEVEKRVKIQCKSVVHESSPYLKTPSKTRQNGPGATFAHRLMARQLTQAQIAYKEEFRFEPKRRWRFDFLIRDIALEIDGGLWINGGHSRGKGRISDMEKQNHATLLGYKTLRFTPAQVKSGTALEYLKNMLNL